MTVVPKLPEARPGPDLAAFLSSALGGPLGAALATAILALAAAAAIISALLAKVRWPDHSARRRKAGHAGDQQKQLDVMANAKSWPT